MDNPLTLCPFKETLVYLTTCRKCSYSIEKCTEAKAARKESVRQCIDCAHGETSRRCKGCLDFDPDHRARPFWKHATAPKPEVISRTGEEGERPFEKQLSLF